MSLQASLLELVPPPSPFIWVLVLWSRALPLRDPVFSKGCRDAHGASAHYHTLSSSPQASLTQPPITPNVPAQQQASWVNSNWALVQTFLHQVLSAYSTTTTFHDRLKNPHRLISHIGHCPAHPRLSIVPPFVYSNCPYCATVHFSPSSVVRILQLLSLLGC